MNKLCSLLTSSVVFHHDIKSSSHCQHPRAIKPNTSDIKEELICVNPYHYDLNTELDTTRTKKQPKQHLKAQSQLENESDEETLTYEDDGVDYIKLWDEKAIKPSQVGKQMITFETLMKELKFFTLNHETKELTHTKIEKKITEDIKSMLLSGKYKALIENMPAKLQGRRKDRDLMPPPSYVSGEPVGPMVVEEEDSAIQNLLDDIRGSFERQFDDEFNDLNEDGSRSSSPFGNINIGTTFSMSDGHALEDLAVSAEDILASSPDEMPLEGWTMSQEVFDNFLEAASNPANADPSGDQFNFNDQQRF